MSIASEAKKDCETMAAYALMDVKQVSAFLRVAPSTVRTLDLPWVHVGKQMKLNPLHLAVYMLAQEEGVTVEAYWAEHGEASVDHAQRYIRRIRKLLAA